ncbi:hypothetical protein M431DRAFT_419367 [Trichoderma harzianum CBS 226.95]|uniref:Uncharacterized protein n=1 Tax=Trichoderma harzianum CBS 226.95 TaxID=983964 RepID=A0A2T4AGE2_TRIHA|nr:hypothetical protein M431DRAFT_419367 [Trichoderma harzianum CBS 226.95]PTB56155.1 hypothetical protein M431DRAFT_419367 [Trichoderma harzianum CBS 226.95]
MARLIGQICEEGGARQPSMRQTPSDPLTLFKSLCEEGGFKRPHATMSWQCRRLILSKHTQRTVRRSCPKVPCTSTRARWLAHLCPGFCAIVLGQRHPQSSSHARRPER